MLTTDGSRPCVTLSRGCGMSVAASVLAVATVMGCNTRSVSEIPSADPVAELDVALTERRRELLFRQDRGYLDAVLQALDVPVASQVLVYSKTSRHRERINEANPRAIYFNDTTAVGWVPGAADLELITFSGARRGPVFYTLSQRPASTPRFEAGQRCFECHTIEGRGGMQGWLVRSVIPSITLETESRLVDERTPLGERWGGWYVTGGQAGTHLGAPVPGLLPNYPAPGSDIGALTVLAHQATMTNLIAGVHVEAARYGGAPANERRERSVDLDARIADLVDGLLFIEEAPLPVPLQPGRAFLDAFAARAQRARALRDLDVTRRLQTVRCSFMIDSAPFLALAADIRQRVYRRMRTTLDDPSSGIGAHERQQVLELLTVTLADWPTA